MTALAGTPVLVVVMAEPVAYGLVASVVMVEPIVKVEPVGGVCSCGDASGAASVCSYHMVPPLVVVPMMRDPLS